MRLAGSTEKVTIEAVENPSIFRELVKANLYLFITEFSKFHLIKSTALRDLLVETDIPGRLLELSHSELHSARYQHQDVLQPFVPGIVE